jgi:EF-P beta-lysylation protein EpmB
MAKGFNDPEKLLTFLGHDPEKARLDANALFRTRVPQHFVNKMRYGDLHCPLLRQVLPIGQELEEKPEFILDPLQEKRFNHLPGLLHKYQGRVLITLAGSCAVNCRYCFRRHFSYKENQINLAQWQKILDYIKSNLSIEEVIFSGGDPLMVKTERLAHYMECLQDIPHIHTLRFHTRMPIVLPERIDKTFIELMAKISRKVVMVMHANHPQELCDDTLVVFDALRKNNVTLLNQSVLLCGVNDNVETLKSLSKKLFSQGVLPYYLHLPDEVAGTAHFDVSIERAKQIYLDLQAQLPGYLVPKLVKEIPGQKSKTRL